MGTDWSLTVYRGPAGDHNDRAVQAVTEVGAAFARRLGLEGTVVGEPVPARPAWWDVELDRAREDLRAMAARIDDVLTRGRVPVTAMTRCAVALATQPVVLRHRPDAVVVWLDAHGDVNVPGDTRTGFLGGMVSPAAWPSRGHWAGGTPGSEPGCPRTRPCWSAPGTSTPPRPPTSGPDG